VVVRVSGALGLLAGVAAVALLPLYGDPGPSSIVSHPEWARLVLRGLDLVSDTPGVNDTATQVFATLSGRGSRTFRADQYVRAARVELQGHGAAERLEPVGGIGEAVYALSVARGGEYHVRFRVAGPAPAEAELTRAGQDAVLRRLSVPAAPVMSWVDAGAVHLDPGAYQTTVLLPQGAALQYVEVAPPCVHAIEPRGGWKPAAVASTDDVAVTTLQALDLEYELPPAGTPIELHGSDLRLEDGSAVEPSSTLSGAFNAGPGGARVLLVVDVPSAGLYTLSVWGVPSTGQRWLVDGCQACRICPLPDPTPRWRTILSGHLQKGRHVFSALLGAGAIIQRLRLEPKKESAADYRATLERLGLALGPDGPITRAKAEEARRFIERRHAQQVQNECGDIVERGTLAADVAGAGSGGGEAGGAGGGGVPPGGGPGGGGGGGSVPPPIVPPVPPASPTLPTGFSGS
jgi:hypothetical protein